MLINTLNTNEVKQRNGTEVEFSRIASIGRTTEFAAIAETPSLPHRLSVKHTESGVGVKQRRRSVIRIDKSSISGVDPTLTVTTSAFLVLDAPVGALSNTNEMADVIAEVLSFCATTGAGTTVLFDGTGNGAKALLEGGL